MKGKKKQTVSLVCKWGKIRMQTSYFNIQGRERVDQILMEIFLPDIISYFLN